MAGQRSSPGRSVADAAEVGRRIGSSLRLARSFAAITAAVVLVGCGERSLRVESDTRWSGTMEGTGGRVFEGHGNASFPIRGGKVCWRFAKETEEGALRVYAKYPSRLGNDRIGDATTSAPYGVVSGCAP